MKDSFYKLVNILNRIFHKTDARVDTKTHLEASGAPVHKLNRFLCLDERDGRIHILRK